MILIGNNMYCQGAGVCFVRAHVGTSCSLLSLLYLVAQVEPSARRIRDLYEAAVDQFGSSYPGKYGRS